MALQAGEMVGAYKIVEQLGQGGMATVYKAYHARLDRHVALKMMHSVFLEDASFRSRFEREAQIVARLEHPNIIPVYDYNEHDHQPYLVMKYVEGRTLKALLSDGQLPTEEILRIMTPIAAALNYAHDKGVLHRDIKPSNIVLDERGTPYLTDFGLARIAQSGASTMSADVMIGTPHYISPEQAMGSKDIDARTDLYSLGIVLYEMLTGRVPFAGDTSFAIVHDQIYTPPPPPSQINPALSGAVEAVLLKALSKAPDERFASANEMIHALRAALQDGTVPAEPVRRTVPTPPIPPRVEAPHIDVPNRKPKDSPMIIPDAPFREVERAIGRADQAVDEAVERANRQIERGMRQAQRNMQRSMQRSGFSPPGRRMEMSIEVNRGSDWDDDDEKELQLDLLTDEEGIRRRAQQRVKERGELIGHLSAYAVVATIMWVISIGGSLWGASDWPIFPAIAVTFGWGAGVAAHVIGYYRKSGARLEARSLAVQDAMREEYGEYWRDEVDEETYQNTRRAVYVRYKRRTKALQHLGVYLSVNILLWLIFFQTSSGDLDGIPWAIWPTLGWGIPMALGVLSEFGGGKLATGHNDAMQRELEAERERMMVESGGLKRKREEADLPPVRLSSEGELTDSYVDEIDAQRRRKR